VAQGSADALSGSIFVATKTAPRDQPRLRRLGADGGELRLLCDEMLKGIGRWLRAAGYDVAIADDGGHDDELLARTRGENRLLLTCDRRLAARAGDNRAVALLATESLDDAARELSTRLGIDWLHAPFTRCLVDNACLVPAGKADVAGLPLTARQGAGRIMRCPRCGRVFWPGSHVRRMRARLAQWQTSGATRRP
jgi:uncharacterized protein with PIN domain